MTWNESAKWAAISGLVYIVLATMINIAMPGILAGVIGYYALMVFTCNLFVYKFNLYRTLP